MSWRRCPVRPQLCLLCLAVLGTTAGPSARADSPPSDPGEVAWLIRQLGETAFPWREEATLRLADLDRTAQIGAPDVRGAYAPPLTQGSSSGLRSGVASRRLDAGGLRPSTPPA